MVGGTWDGISFSLKKEGSSGPGFGRDEPGGRNAKRNKPDTKGQIRHDSTCPGPLEGANLESQRLEWWVPGPGEMGSGEQVCNGDRVQQPNKRSGDKRA